MCLRIVVPDGHLYLSKHSSKPSAVLDFDARHEPASESCSHECNSHDKVKPQLAMRSFAGNLSDVHAQYTLRWMSVKMLWIFEEDIRKQALAEGR